MCGANEVHVMKMHGNGYRCGLDKDTIAVMDCTNDVWLALIRPRCRNNVGYIHIYTTNCIRALGALGELGVRTTISLRQPLKATNKQSPRP